jgi:hypothetical protein
MAVASDHVKLDTQQVFAGVIPAMQQLGQVMAQFSPKPQVDPADQAILQASMAETQRRAQKDQMDNQYDQAKLQADIAESDKERQIKVAINAENNLTQERIKTAELTVDNIRLQKEQNETAVKLHETTQRKLGDTL